MHPSDDSGPDVEMPRYQSNKHVWALKVKNCGPYSMNGKGLMVVKLSFHDAGYADIEVPQEVVARHEPKDGDYYVVYEDGYKSISPKKAFEEGYTRLRLKFADDPAEPRPR